MSYRLVIVMALLLSGLCTCGWADDPVYWMLTLQTSRDTWVGARPDGADGYDGQTPLGLSGFGGGKLFLLLYREQGPGWAGPTSFYDRDFESPIPPGGSKTWWDLYLWTDTALFTPTANVKIMTDGMPAPVGYWAELVVDYVPESLNWTGPMKYTVPVYGRNYVLLPVPLVSNGLEGTRLHFTVYAPVPEPSSLSALGLASSGLGLGLLRRRRK